MNMITINFQIFQLSLKKKILCFPSPHSIYLMFSEMNPTKKQNKHYVYTEANTQYLYRSCFCCETLAEKIREKIDLL